MDVRRISNWEDLYALRDAWNALTDDVPFRRWDWLATWWKHYGLASSKHDLFVLAIIDSEPEFAKSNRGRPSGECIGIAPWMIRNSASNGRSIEFLGEEEACTDHRTILALPERRLHVAQTIADYLVTEYREWDLINLIGVDDGDPIVDHLTTVFEEHDFDPPRATTAHNCWRIELPADWDAFLSMLSKSHRTTMRRTFRRIEELGELEVRTAATQDDLANDWPRLVELHQMRWESLGERGCFASPRFSAFHAEVAPMLLQSGNLRLMTAELDGKHFSSEYNLVSHTSSFAYQSGIDPRFLHLEPGRIVMATAIRTAIDEGLQWHDYLRGDEHYKAHWRAKPTPARTYRWVNTHATARLRDVGRRAAENAKELVKLGLGRSRSLND